ncbi:hypothetical protein HIM_04092 [Hirsutella minnesotensis 3608]|uniref:Uncharacterized protein n=1 Tax=Hirsutella minnesotensis 3608 TaxID=1043627 RepID=A0A0F7ZVC3_9HYPO|nr:hypothetical protein HIM_04092 [Hirsutella minnesotensis 3608]
MDRSQPSHANLLDVHDRLIADILTHYRTLMMLATDQADGETNNARPEVVAVAGISMSMAFDGLYTSIKELLALSRRVKELWVFGPLGQGDPDHRAREAQVESDVARVSALLNDLEAFNMHALAQSHGGSWARLVKDAPAAASADER